MGSDTMQTDASDTMDVTATVAVVHPTKDSDVMGTVTFTKEGDGVRVQGNISGLKEGKHGFHIHQYGDCRADDGSSAGGHYNPAGNDHAARTDSVRHMGDMGNITADADGNASVDYVDSVIDMNMIMGRAVVIHGGEDDLTSQPSGAAGARMACGVIGIANPDQ
ncbi:MAG TPA: superoxide dismutase family protein, partial [Fodinibius sp.]|nr:superoxide dismutase family protein [Fodinibius sp.]